MSDSQPNWGNILIAFNVLNCLAIFLIVLVLIPPLFCKSVHRRIPWYSHMLSWLVVAIALLLMIGHQKDTTPPAGLCFIQSALLYATPPLTAFSMTCYLLDINLAITSLLSRRSLRRKSRVPGTSVLLAFFPWVVFLGVIVEVSIVFSVDTYEGKYYPRDNKELHLFCHYNIKSTNIVTISLVAMAALVLVPVKAWTVFLLVQKFRSFEWTSVKISQMVLGAFIRTAVFTGIALVGIILGELSCTIKSGEAAWSLVMPLMPIIAAMVYGVHKDTLQCLMFWRKRADPEEDQGQERSPPLDDEETMAVSQTEAKNPAQSVALEDRKPEVSVEVRVT